MRQCTAPAHQRPIELTQDPMVTGVARRMVAGRSVDERWDSQEPASRAELLRRWLHSPRTMGNLRLSWLLREGVQVSPSLHLVHGAGTRRANAHTAEPRAPQSAEYAVGRARSRAATAAAAAAAGRLVIDQDHFAGPSLRPHGVGRQAYAPRDFRLQQAPAHAKEHLVDPAIQFR